MNDAADYTRPVAAKPRPLTLEQAARITPPAQVTDTEGLVDVPRMRAWRRNRLRDQIAACGLDAVVLVEPLSIRYATGVRNCALFQMHIQAGYLFMSADGPVIYFDNQPGRETGRQLETIDEVCDDLVPLSHMFSGHRQQEKARKWAAQMGDVIRNHCGAGGRIGVERAGFHAEQALLEQGFALVDAAPVLAHARKIKCPEEILAMNLALAAAEDGMTRMRAALRNGITEQALWALIWQALVEHGGEWLDYRLLASGERTNPWQQEASSRTIRAGDLVVFDCGMVGPFSYGADVSRAFHCGPGRPSDPQKKLYTLAWNEVMHNTQLLKAGTSFREFIDARHAQEPGFGDQPYPCAAHGVGMADEWPVILHSCAVSGWIEVCASDDIDEEDLVRWDHDGGSFAIYHTKEGFFATDAYCTHQQADLADGVVIGTVIECPLHQGRFDIGTGKALRAPARIDLCTYPVKVEDGIVHIKV